MSATSTQVIDPAIGVSPIGLRNGVNLIFRAPEKFRPETLQVFLSGLYLTSEDFKIETDNETFIIVLEPSDPTRLNVPPLQYENFRLNYVKA